MKNWFFWLLFSQMKKEEKNLMFKVLNIFRCSQAGIHQPVRTFQRRKNKCQCYNLLNASDKQQTSTTTNSHNLNHFYINLNFS